MQILIDRYNPQSDSAPYTQSYHLIDDEIGEDTMLLELLQRLRIQDPTLGFRSSCQEGVCGSDGMNVNGNNCLSCITLAKPLGNRIHIRPLPGFPVIKDLIVDMQLFYDQYKNVDPYLKSDEKLSSDPEHEILQSPEEREKLDGSYECILCACCSSSCPSFWWNPDLFPGPAALLAANRFVIDSRDITTIDRLKSLDKAEKTFRCRHIQNCTAACPKGLNPSRAIQGLKHKIVKNRS
ncbi:succinate dehydrogenase iron-sulfur subunit [Thiomicrorhabdus xiamenensis]|uniref:Succinate dehydrogenase iron-sulfur subunit n=1 Tax=Thiomicrorhabdus xiamenensis TaxID=2739063 RepID=A0A7D4TCF1_9GAMM|nr:succinate dehydrogenase iron-sulfur subunit [Thiomicrorhabdus xiamenensis]QKI90306.1 succinate dehydrogenase iron-sulfur subunit [Thiomicrorhabdus xiamenensis]